MNNKLVFGIIAVASLALVMQRYNGFSENKYGFFKRLFNKKPKINNGITPTAITGNLNGHPIDYSVPMGKDKNICFEGYSLVQPKCLTTPCASFCVKNR